MERLHVSTNGRYLMKESGAPFFYLGDTAWEVFHRLNREEADLYLQNRARKGFTVIQAVALAELDGLHTPNAYGDFPLHGDDPWQPNEAYFAHVDYIVQRAKELGLMIGMLPTWADKVGPIAWGVGPMVFTPENAYAYGKFLGTRYQDAPIIWIIGGDRPIDTEEQRAIWRAMANGIRETDTGQHLMTFHPMGGHSSSEYVHAESWLDFNMLQSSHGSRHNPNYRMVLADRMKQPVKPVLDGEPRYEDHPVDGKPDLNGWFTEVDVREATYWGLLAGGCGITYGCHDIWQFWQPGRDPINHVRTDWQEAMDLPGAFQMQYARALYESRPFTLLSPYQEAIHGAEGEGGEHVRVARAEDGSFLFAYLPTGAPLTLRLQAITGDKVIGHWFDPRQGTWTPCGTWPNTGEQTFIPPTRGEGQDWVLVLDDTSKQYPAPVCPWAE